jgi:hypothetical protein
MKRYGVTRGAGGAHEVIIKFLGAGGTHEVLIKS